MDTVLVSNDAATSKAKHISKIKDLKKIDLEKSVMNVLLPSSKNQLERITSLKNSQKVDLNLVTTLMSQIASLVLGGQVYRGYITPRQQKFWYF